MSKMQQQKCPNCTAPVRFDPSSGKLVCDFCGGVFAPEALWEKQEPAEPEKDSPEGEAPQSENRIEGFDFKALLHQAEAKNSTDIPIYSCQSCGAEILVADEAFSLTCPFCRNHVILTNKVSGKLRPDSVIPFKITSEGLLAAVKKYYKGQKYIPKKFFSENKMGKVTGIYVPFWVFSGTAEGELYYSAETSGKSRRVGDYIEKTYKVWRLERGAALAFKDVPVDASEKMDDALMDSIEPFDMSEEKPFDIRYLAGYAADRFDVAAECIVRRAEERMTQTVGLIARAMVGGGYQSVRQTGSNLKADLKARYVLMPVYQFDLEFESKKYSFVVNGQTGKVVGNLPYDGKLMMRARFLRMAMMTGLVLGAAIIRYLMGG